MIHDVRVNNFIIPANTEQTWDITLPHTIDTFDFSSACDNVPQSVRVFKVDHAGSNFFQVYSLTAMASGQYCGARIQKDGYKIRIYCKANAAIQTTFNWRIIYNN